jgi:DtxR family transcriptional regulator, Mn-dependent transcriptional regulator
MQVSPRPYEQSECRSCDLTEAVEDYLKAVYHLAHTDGSTSASAIAEQLDVSLPSVSAMVKRLVAADLLARCGSRDVALTDHGRAHALRIVRRHRLLESFLVGVLDVPWDEVHAEAEVLEHALSDRLEERIDLLLGHPTRDPHGDPIPPRAGTHEEDWAEPLDTAPPGCRFRVERVRDRDSAALRHLGDVGIRPGVTIDVERRDPFGGPLWVRVGVDRHALGSGLTRLVHCIVEGGR